MTMMSLKITKPVCSSFMFNMCSQLREKLIRSAEGIFTAISGQVRTFILTYYMHEHR
jgi:hypothetical protein